MHLHNANLCLSVYVTLALPFTRVRICLQLPNVIAHTTKPINVKRGDQNAYLSLIQFIFYSDTTVSVETSCSQLKIRVVKSAHTDKRIR